MDHRSPNHWKAEEFLDVPTSISGKLLDRYLVLEKIGEGMSWVYRAHDVLLNCLVVLKRVPAWALGDPNRVARLLQEARCLRALNHRNIVQILDVGAVDGIAFIVLEFVPGKTLNQVITSRTLTLREAFQYAMQIAAALAQVHAAGIIHRDLKPSNVLVGGDGLIKVLDFGLAKPMVPLRNNSAQEYHGILSSPETLAGEVLGSIGYMSPEQAVGLPADYRSDIFSFGVMLYEMLASRRAFRAETDIEAMKQIQMGRPMELPQTIPPAISQLVWRCLEKQPELRFPSAKELLAAMSILAETNDVVSVTRPKRSPRVIALGALGLLGAALGAYGCHRRLPPRK